MKKEGLFVFSIIIVLLVVLGVILFNQSEEEVNLSPEPFVPVVDPIASFEFDGNYGSSVGDFQVTPANAEFQAGYEGQAIHVSRNGYISIADHEAFDFQNRFTLEGWFMYDRNANNERLISKENGEDWSYRLLSLGKGNFGQQDSLFLQVNDGENIFSMVTNLRNQAPNYIDNWVHIRVTYNGFRDGSKFYINGVEAPAFYTNDGVLGGIKNSDAPLMIGATNLGPDWGLGAFYRGKIDNVKIYDVVVDGKIKSGEPFPHGSCKPFAKCVCGDEAHEYPITSGDETKCCAFVESSLNEEGVCFQDDGRSRSKYISVPFHYDISNYDGGVGSSFSCGGASVISFDSSISQFKDSIAESFDFEFSAVLERPGEDHSFTFDVTAFTHTPDSNTMNLEFPCFDDVSSVMVYDDEGTELCNMRFVGDCS